MGIPIGKAVVSLCTCLLAAATVAGEIELLSTDYPPYFASHLPAGGPMTEIVVEAFRRAGHEVTIEFVPWVRAIEYAKAGKVDGLHGAWHSRAREQWFIFSDPMPGNELVLLARVGEGPGAFTGFADLGGYTIGVVKGYRNPTELVTHHLQVDEASSDVTNLKKLARGRVDLILIERAVARYLLAGELRELRDHVRSVEPPVEVLPLHVMISKRAEDAQAKIENFNRGLAALAAEGGITEILERHGISAATAQGAGR